MQQLLVMCGTQGTDFRGSDSTIEEADHCYSGTARSSFCSHGRLELLSGTAVAKMATNMSVALQDMYYDTAYSGKQCTPQNGEQTDAIFFASAGHEI